MHKIKMCVLLENNTFQLDSYFLEAIRTSKFRAKSFQGNTKLYAKYMNAIFGDQLYLLPETKTIMLQLFAYQCRLLITFASSL